MHTDCSIRIVTYKKVTQQLGIEPAASRLASQRFNHKGTAPSHTHTCTHARTHTYIHTYIHTHTLTLLTFSTAINGTKLLLCKPFLYKSTNNKNFGPHISHMELNTIRVPIGGGDYDDSIVKELSK